MWPSRMKSDEGLFWKSITSARGAPPPLFLDQTIKGDLSPSPRYLKVWIWHCYLPPKLLQYVAYAVTLRSHGRAEAGRHKLEHILLLKVH